MTIEPEIVNTYRTMQDETLGAINDVQRAHNFWVRTVAALEVPTDRNDLEEALRIYHILSVAHEAMIEFTEKLGMLKEAMTSEVLLDGFKNCGIESERVGDVKFSVETRHSVKVE